ncbi:GNAT family N-acetyltransferase [Clostridium sp. LIBA-8841]|uniref:GNAT family N-acetyltransferase n=1 Tax=Clostridium sp. LIBA-8841 TaxID=2987530 RepID=UPI002AC3B040|nr:GNAT family N-acetyltransferase [Clostridium sp. LIBA-8841]MDZ5253651.1 GNAT family N-acetyltransferase [Clostridium sp. LIBA-8841]
MKIRKVLQSEIESFYELIGEVEYSLFSTENEEHMNWLKKKIDRFYYSGAEFFGAFNDNNEILGIITILIDKPPQGINNGYNSCEVIEMGINKEVRNKGYGSKLLNYAENYAKEQNIYCMYMHTYAGDHDVIAFYGKNGFVPVGIIPDIYGPKNEGMLYMRKVIR